MRSVLTRVAAITLFSLTVTLLGWGFSGCGKGSPPRTEPDAPPSGEVRATPTTSAAEAEKRKTFTRKEVRDLLTQHPGEEPKKSADVKRLFGLPDSTREMRLKNNTPCIEYRYRGLTVDADGSGKVDAVTLIFLNNDIALPAETVFEP